MDVSIQTLTSSAMTARTTRMRLGATTLAFVFLMAWSGSARAQLFTPVESTAGVSFIHNEGYKFGSDAADDVMMNVGTGAAWFDYDNDGDLDLYVTQRRNAAGTLSNLLYENDGTGNFTDVTALRGAGDSGNQGCGVAVADYDNDGDEDIYLANCTEDVLLQNQLTETGTPNFVDVTSTAFPGFTNFLPQRGHSASWGDYDADGCLDLYVANHMPIDPDAGDVTNGSSSQDFLFHNNCESATGGTTTFTDMSSLLNGDADDIDADGIPDGDGVNDLEGFGFIAAWTDIDLDGDLDLYLMNDCPFGIAQGFGRTEDNKLWQNNGDGTFTEISDTFGPLTTTGKDANEGDGNKPDCQNAMGIAIGDPDRDGDMDYFYTNLEGDATPAPGEQSATMIENLRTSFDDVTTAAGLFQAKVPPDETLGRITWGAVFLDYDLDMLQDLAVASGAIFDDKNLPNMLYHNANTGSAPAFSDGTTFTDVSTGSGIEDDFLGGTKTLVMGDYDGDGDPDLFGVSFGEQSRLYRNDNSNGNNWLIIDVEGDGPALGGANKDGIGTRIRVRTPDGVNQFYEVHSGSNLGGGDDMGAYFGLGSNTEADVIIQFLGQSVLPSFTVAANNRILVKEDGVPLPVELAKFEPIRNGDRVTLRWETVSEASNAGFEVQHKGPDGVFTTMAFIEGAGTTTEAQSYAYEVAGLEPGTHTFRLKQKDFNGWYFYSEEVEVFVELPEAYLLTPPYPNPFNPQAQFSLAVRQTQQVRVAVYDVLGREVAQLFNGVLPANETHQFTIDGSGFSSGLYLVQVIGEQFSATRQVTLLK